MLFLTSRVDKDKIGVFYSIIAVIMTIGGIVGGPIFGGSFAVGLKLSGSWMGLPFYIAASIYGLSSVGIWLFVTDS